MIAMMPDVGTERPSRRSVLVGIAASAGAAASPPAKAGKASGDSIDQRLAELGVILPNPAAPVATYAPFRTVGRHVFIAGQGPAASAGVAIFGKVGRELTTEQGYAAARLAGISILAQAKAACGGDLGRISHWVHLTGYVNCVDDFADHPKVVNGASDLLQAVFGDNGLHARAAVGVSSLPFNLAVEIEASFALTD
jgi:enamine deaminase RidA (YjgF/YER057c/UK114 family)